MKELREKLSAKLKELRQIIEKARGEKRRLTAEEETQYATLKTEADSIKGQIADEERAAALQADLDENENQLQAIAPETQRGQRSADADDAEDAADPSAPERRGAPRAHRENRGIRLVGGYTYEPGDALGTIVAARFRFGTDHAAARRWAEREYGSGSPQFRAMQQSVFTAGGSTIAQNFVASELIELLRAKAAVRRAGARSLPLVNGSATLPKVTGGATTYWRGNEGDIAPPSELTTGDITLTEKELTCLVPVNNNLLRNSNIAVDRLIRDDMVRAAANSEDIAFLKGPGTSGQPKGIYYWVGDPGRDNSAGSTLANSRTNIRTAKNRLGTNNVPNDRRAWFMNSRAIEFMAWDLVDANSNRAYPQLENGDGSKLAGGTVFEDNNISIVLGGGTDTEIYYAEMSECFIGDSGELELELFLNATYEVTSGSLRSGISRNESVVRLIRKTDFALRHVESAHVLEACGYGA